MQIDLTDQVALVTGSAHRVGKAIALELAKQGVHIMVHYHRSAPDIVRETVHEIKSLGVDAFEIQADISQPDGVQTVFNTLKEHFGKLNILVNSASAFQKRQLMEVSFEDWELTMAVNVRAPFLCTRAAAEMMTESGGAIINICDRGVDGPWVEYAHHGVSKAALWALTQVSAASLGPRIRVNAIIPGAVMKPDGASMSDEDWAKVGEGNVLKRTGDASDVGRAVVYLAREGFLSGTLLHVNAGEHLL